MPRPVQLIDDALLDATLARAKVAPRGRINHNLHSEAAPDPSRFLNAWTRGSYAAPHRHSVVPKPESFIILRGEMVLFLFDDAGVVTEQVVLGRNGVWGIDVAPALWHTVAVLTDTAVCFEIKAGPYDAATDKEFAPWAPREGEAGAADYLQALLARPGL
jgi:cupin fold WbuC family metalloprotein